MPIHVLMLIEALLHRIMSVLSLLKSVARAVFYHTLRMIHQLAYAFQATSVAHWVVSKISCLNYGGFDS